MCSLAMLEGLQKTGEEKNSCHDAEELQRSLIILIQAMLPHQLDDYSEDPGI